METWWRELRERLLRIGVAPRHVRRILTELREHWADLAAEEERAGRDRAEAEALALARLGRMEDLARAVAERPELRSWTARAPWAVLGGGPVLALAAGWGLSLLILWTGWTWFLPSQPTPFVRLHGFVIAYFGFGKMLYFSAPLLAGWGTVVLAGRQRARALWPVLLGSLAVAMVGTAGAVEVRPPAAPGTAGAVGMRFFSPAALTGDAALHALLLFALVSMPYLLWRWRSSRQQPER